MSEIIHHILLKIDQSVLFFIYLFIFYNKTNTIYVSEINGLRLKIAENDNDIIEKGKEYPRRNSTKTEYNIHQNAMKL